MPGDSAPRPGEAAADPARVAGAAGWLYSRPTDLFIMLAPFAATAVCAAVELSRGQGRVLERDYAAWISQFVFGNTSHVILTFLLLLVRRDVLRAAPNQARLIVVGGVTAFLASFGFLWLFARTIPAWVDFGTSIVVVFATHHALSQTKGIWALYGLRAVGLGLGRPDRREQNLQRVFVPIGLVLLMVRLLFVPAETNRTFPLLQAIPGQPAVLPFAVVWGLVFAWVAYAAYVALAMRRGGASPARALYVLLHCLAVAITLRWPAWGTAVSAGMHGLEYYFLSARMLGPAQGETSRVRGPIVWVCMAVAMAPALVIGVLLSPFKGAFGLPASANDTVEIGRLLLNAVVMTHYFTDAFIYRFRIPSVRAVALRRLHFV